MPPHERVAKFRSARLTHRLTGHAEQAALVQMQLQSRLQRRVYALAADSREVKAKVSDFAFADAGKPGELSRCETRKHCLQHTALQPLSDAAW